MRHTQHAMPQLCRLIPLGRLVATPHALALLEKAKLSTFALFARQERGDWGDVDIEDAMANEQALINVKEDPDPYYQGMNRYNSNR